MPLSGFRELRSWRAAMDVVEGIYEIAKRFPRHQLYGLAGQMRRAAVSVPSNIAEGYAGEHRNEYLLYMSIAQASVAELATQVKTATRLDVSHA